jgi:hypothetical protein
MKELYTSRMHDQARSVTRIGTVLLATIASVVGVPAGEASAQPLATNSTQILRNQRDGDPAWVDTLEALTGKNGSPRGNRGTRASSANFCEVSADDGTVYGVYVSVNRNRRGVVTSYNTAIQSDHTSVPLSSRSNRSKRETEWDIKDGCDIADDMSAED